MNLLILGGTVFLGRAFVEAAQKRGHTLTLFNRGKSNAELYPHIEKLYGERGGDLSVLAGRRWDAVIDTSGYIPRQVRASTERLKESVEQYTFISSISVYKDFSTPGYDESAPLASTDQETDEVTGDNYGAYKALSEQAVENAFPGRALHVRAGLIVGPHDYSGRFPYWVKRIAQGGEVLAPGRSERQLQFIDARDLAGWCLDMIEAHKSGAFNTTGPNYPLTMGQLLETCKTETGSDAQLTWVSEKFLTDAEVNPWLEMPLWLPEGIGEDGFLAANFEKALAAGLHFRPLSETVRDTWQWLNAPDETQLAGRALELKAGLAADKEAALLAKWHGQ